MPLIGGHGGRTKGAVQVKSSNYTALATDSDIFCTAGASGITVTLYSSPAVGSEITVYKDDSAAGYVTIVPASGTINGASNYLLISQYETVTLKHNGIQWRVK